MHIAFISYEYPPETSYGGIGTYTFQLSTALAAMGHDVEVFSCSHKKQLMNECIHPHLLLHRVVANKRKIFSDAIVAIFSDRHSIYPFDIIESPEFGAEGAGIKRHFPNIPFTIKLHTPFYLHNRYNKNVKNVFLIERCKCLLKKFLNYQNYNKEADADYLFTITADSVSSPSFFLADILRKDWNLTNIKLLPNYYKANNSLLQLPIELHSKKVIGFIGRLEKRKGIYTILNAIPSILAQYPDTIFRFIGAPGFTRDSTTLKDNYIHQTLERYPANLQFTGYMPSNKLADAIKDVSVIIIPSIFENFPYVCLEAMAAGKSVIISSNSGMKEMFPNDKNRGCMIINPNNSKQLSKAVIHLLNHNELRMQMGVNNRAYVIQQFACDELLDRVIQFYKDTIFFVTKKGIPQQL